MESTACPVCTLYLREGISLYDHLDTHPKDQVIEALIRIRERDESTTPSQQMLSIPTSQSTPFYPSPQPCYPVHQYSANSYAYQQMAIMGNSSIPSHMAPVAMVMPPNTPNPNLMQVMYNPYMLQQQNIHLVAPHNNSPSVPSSAVHHESPMSIPKINISANLNTESVQTNLTSDSTPFHLHSPPLETRKRQSPAISHSGFVPPLPTTSQPVRPAYDEDREEGQDEETEEAVAVKLPLHSEESPASPSSHQATDEFVQTDPDRSSRVRFIHYQLPTDRSARSSHDSPNIFVIQAGSDKETSAPWSNPETGTTVTSVAPQFVPGSCPQNIISSGLRELIANNTIKLTPIPIQGKSVADSDPPVPSISLTIRSKRKERPEYSPVSARTRSVSNSSSRSDGGQRASKSPPGSQAERVDAEPSCPDETEYYLSQPCSSRRDLDATGAEEADAFGGDVSLASRRANLKTDHSDDEAAADCKGNVDLLPGRERDYEDAAAEPAEAARAASPAFRRISVGSRHAEGDAADRDDPLEVHRAVGSIVVQPADRDEYITSDCTFDDGRRPETPTEEEAAVEEYESRFLKECMGGRDGGGGGYDAPSPVAVEVVAFGENSQGSEREYLTLSTVAPGMQPKVLKQQIDDLNVSTSYEVLAREGWAVMDVSDTETGDRRPRREPTPEPRWQEVRLSSPPPPTPPYVAAAAAATRPYKCALCGETFNCPKERRVHRSAFHPAKAKCPADAEAAPPLEPGVCGDGEDADAVKAKPRAKKRVVKACQVLVVQSASDKFTGVFVKEDGVEPMEVAAIKTEGKPRATELDGKPAEAVAGGSVIKRAPKKHQQVRGGPYKCVSCPSQFLMRTKLLQHMRLEHKNLKLKNPYICNVCQEVFTNDKRYSEHLRMHPLECKTCCKTFFRRQNLVLHMRRHLGIKPYPCSMCTKSFITKQKLGEHKNVHLNLAPIKCTLCTMAFRRYSNLIQHKNRFHYMVKKKVKDYVCFCGEIYHSKKKLDWHKEIHEKKPKCCKFCSERFVHTASLTRHIRRAHDRRYMPKVGRETENVECSVCGHVFLKSSLLVHMRLHTGERPFSCTVCGKSFTTKWNLQQHRWTHMSRSSKPFKCNQCKSAFARESDYTQHMDSHSNKRPYTCNVCGLQFVRKNNCIRHAKEHQTAKMFTCKVCSKSFHRGYYLKDHMMVHSGARPFTCHICGKASSTKSNHNKHVKIHHAREPVNTEA